MGLLSFNFNLTPTTSQVSDTGIGIAPDDLAAIWKPFHRGRVWNERREGTGLGLSIVRSIVSIMGGTVNLSSELGHGTLVRVLLPLVTRPKTLDPSAAGVAMAVVDAQECTRLLREMKPFVLIVEDQPTNQLILQGFLNRMGLETVIAANGLEAVNECNAREFDIVLMDINMPVMGGLEAAKRIRSDVNRQGNPAIIAVTASCLPQELDLISRAGMDGVITKPVSKDAISREMFRCLHLKIAQKGSL